MHDKSLIVDQLGKLGVEKGDTVMVHAGLRKIGPIDGGAVGLIESILQAVCPEGTMLMVLGSPDGVVFHPEESATDPEMGVLAEQFRLYPGTQVNDHPAARFCAIGPLAESLLRDPPLHDYYSHNSVLERFVNAAGKVLRMGADPDTTTVTHLAEYRADVSPKKRVRRRYEHHRLGELWIDSLDDCEGIQEWSGGDYFSQILIDYRQTGAVQSGVVGAAESEVFAAPGFVNFAVGWMEKHLQRDASETR